MAQHAAELIPGEIVVKPSVLRSLLHLAWPVLVAQLAVMANGVIDTVMAGRLSAVDLAAVGIGASIYVTIFVTVTGVLLALTPTIAQLHGAGRHESIGEEVRQSAWLALFLAVIAAVLLRHPGPLLALSRLTPAVESKVRAYLYALSWSAAPAMLLRVFAGFTMGIGLPRAIMGFNLIGVALKLPLNWIFMFGTLERFGGPPPLGGPGCAVATALISALSCVLAWSWCAQAADYRRYRVFADFSPPRARLIFGLLKLGLPIGATFFVDVTAFTFMALFIARLGPVASAAHQIAANLAALAFMLPLALGNASGILAGHALGAGDARRAGRIALTGMVTGVAEGILLSLTLWLGAGTIAGLYTANGEVRRLATTLIGYVAVYHLFDALQAVAVNVLRGYRKSAVPMAIYAVALWGVGLGGGYVLGLTDRVAAPAGVPGFWLAATASLALAGGLVTGYLLRVARAAEITAGAVRKVAA